MMFQSYAPVPAHDCGQNIAFDSETRQNAQKMEIAARVEEMLRLVADDQIR